MSTVEDLSRAILKDLLADFTDRNLTANDLHNGYTGANFPALKERRCGVTSASPVDFDLAVKELERSDLVKTGPMVPHDNPRNSWVFVFAPFSKYEYAFLTEKGYKAAQKTQAARTPTSAPHSVHISGSTFHQSPIGIGGHVTQSVAGPFGNASVFIEVRKAVNSVDNEGDRAALLAAVEAMERAHETPAFVSRYTDFVALAANHVTIIAPIIPALTALLSGG
jgi:hypothetical protein